MALFQIFKGEGEDILLSKVPLHEGYAYFCLETRKLWIDVAEGVPILEGRIPLDAHAADGFYIEGEGGSREFIPADSIAQLSDITATGVMIGDGSGGIAGVEVDGAGGLYALADKIPHWGTIPVTAGGTGQTTHTTNAILTGNGTNAINNVPTADGAFYATGANSAAQFGTLPVAQGGTGAVSAAAARTNLNVYAKNETYTIQETNDEVAKATTLTYFVTLDKDNWSSEAPYTYIYSNTALRCGTNGTVPPIVNCTSNQDEYSNIESAVATSGQGIVFTTPIKPEDDINVVIVDLA